MDLCSCGGSSLEAAADLAPAAICTAVLAYAVALGQGSVPLSFVFAPLLERRCALIG
jgi:hypothetical protein